MQELDCHPTATQGRSNTAHLPYWRALLLAAAPRTQGPRASKRPGRWQVPRSTVLASAGGLFYLAEATRRPQPCPEQGRGRFAPSQGKDAARGRRFQAGSIV